MNLPSRTQPLLLPSLRLAFAGLILPLALAACIGVEQEVDAPPVDVVEVDDGSAGNDADAAEAPAEDAAQDDAGAATGITAVAPDKLNLNTASREDFIAVPNAGERMAKEFDEYRPYATIGQFRAEIGKYVDEAQVAAYEEFLFVPVDPDTADVATVMQIPGMTEATAEALVAGGPYGDAEAFLAALSGLAPEMDLSVAAGYLSQ